MSYDDFGKRLKLKKKKKKDDKNGVLESFSETMSFQPRWKQGFLYVYLHFMNGCY